MPGQHLKRRTITTGLLTILSLSFSAHSQVIRFVDDDAIPGGNGLTWASAYHDFQDALDEARLVGNVITEIRLAAGTYKPDRGTGDLDTVFDMVSGVSVIGGFAGPGAADPDALDPELNETFLSGDLLDNDDIADFSSRDDNTKNTVRALDLEAGTVIDGLTFKSNSSNSSTAALTIGGAPTWRNCRFRDFAAAGCLDTEARFEQCTFIDTFFSGLITAASRLELVDCRFERTGGGKDNAVRIIGEGGLYIFRTCSFIETSALGTYSGGAIDMEADNELRAFDCLFESNVASSEGGAIYGDDCDVFLERCVFRDNHADFSGAAVRMGTGVDPAIRRVLEIKDCEFINNVVGEENQRGSRGGVIDCLSHELIVTGSFFEGNVMNASDGGAIFYWNNDREVGPFVMNDCVFRNNRFMNSSESVTFGNGGALNIAVYDAITLNRCSFENNAVVVPDGAQIGAGILQGGGIQINDCFFGNNAAPGGGGALFFSVSHSVDIERSVFVGNSTGGLGGGILKSRGNGSLSIKRSVFSGNEAGKDGGAIYNSTNKLHLENVQINDNVAFGTGGGIRMVAFQVAGFPQQTDFVNCTVYANHAAKVGGLAIFASDDKANLFTMTNLVLWDNTDDQADLLDAQLSIVEGTADLNVNHSIVQGLTGALGGTGNLDADPLFVDPDGPDNIPGTEDDDLHLVSGSPAIDAGDNAPVLNAGLTLDLDGNARIVNDVVDMGVYEFNALPCVADLAPASTGGDGMVNVEDLLFVLGTWGGAGPADVAPDGGDGVVEIFDLLLILGLWGPCN